MEGYAKLRPSKTLRKRKEGVDPRKLETFMPRTIVAGATNPVLRRSSSINALKREKLIMKD